MADGVGASRQRRGDLAPARATLACRQARVRHRSDKRRQGLRPAPRDHGHGRRRPDDQAQPVHDQGRGTVHTPERPTATVQEVYDLADAIQPRYRALVLMAGFLGLRWGELIGLHRRDVDLDHGTVGVRRAVAELNNGQRQIKAPKSAAGKRTVSIPAAITPDIRDHLKRYAEPGADGRVFIGARGRLRAATTSTGWGARRATTPEINGLHFHDLRHTGNILAASTGASTRELMSRMGHSTARAALIHQHASADCDRLIADALSSLVDKARKKARKAKKKQDRKPKGHEGDAAD